MVGQKEDKTKRPSGGADEKKCCSYEKPTCSHMHNMILVMACGI